MQKRPNLTGLTGSLDEQNAVVDKGAVRQPLAETCQVFGRDLIELVYEAMQSPGI